MKRRTLLCTSILCAFSSLLDARSKPIASTVPAFAEAVALTATNVQAAFDTVQGKFCDAKALNYEVTYSGSSHSDPSDLCQSWLTPDTLAARALILQGLKQYALELSALTSSDTSSLNAATTALATSLTGLTGTAPFKALSTSGAKNLKVDANIFVTAVNALGNWLIQRKVQKELPNEITKMDPTIQSISQLLIADIGTLETRSLMPAKGSGLRQELWIQYTKEIISWDQYVQNKYFDQAVLKSGVSPDASLAAVKQLVALANQRRAADLVLAQVATTIKQMAQAHTELVKATAAKQSLTANLSDLLAEAQRLNTYYHSLGTSN